MARPKKGTPATDAPQQEQLFPDAPIETHTGIILLRHIPASELLASAKPSKEFCDSVKQWGVISPIAVTPATDKDAHLLNQGTDLNFKLLAGRRRVLAAIEAQQFTINAVIFPFGTTTAAMQRAITLMENAQRSNNPLVEIDTIQQLISSGHTWDDIQRISGLTQPQIDKRMQLKNLHPELRTALTAGTLAVGVAERIARLTEAEQYSLVQQLQAGTPLTGKVVTEVRRVGTADAADSFAQQLTQGMHPALIMPSLAGPITNVAAVAGTAAMLAERERIATAAGYLCSTVRSVISGGSNETALAALMQEIQSFRDNIAEGRYATG